MSTEKFGRIYTALVTWLITGGKIGRRIKRLSLYIGVLFRLGFCNKKPNKVNFECKKQQIQFGCCLVEIKKNKKDMIYFKMYLFHGLQEVLIFLLLNIFFFIFL